MNQKVLYEFFWFTLLGNRLIDNVLLLCALFHLTLDRYFAEHHEKAGGRQTQTKHHTSHHLQQRQTHSPTN